MSTQACDPRVIEALLAAPIRTLLTAYRRAITARLDFHDLVHPGDSLHRQALHAQRIVVVAKLDKAVERLLRAIDTLDRLDTHLTALAERDFHAAGTRARPPAIEADNTDLPF